MMYIFKLMKQIHDRDAKNASCQNLKSNSSQINPMTFYGQEMDCLLYLSMEDCDNRVREEARKALKCLGHFGQLRLHQLECSRMGFVGDNPKSSSRYFQTSPSQIRTHQLHSSMSSGISLPNLSGIL